MPPPVLIHVKGFLTKLYLITYWHSVYQQGQLSAILQLNSIGNEFLSGNHFPFHTTDPTSSPQQVPSYLAIFNFDALFQSEVCIRPQKLASTPECSTV